MSMSMHPKIPLLDHGYIQLIEVWGSDERIIESARMSTSGAFRESEGRRGARQGRAQARARSPRTQIEDVSSHRGEPRLTGSARRHL
jgi:hypothetical protein